jgi:hypothetical protein
MRFSSLLLSSFVFASSSYAYTFTNAGATGIYGPTQLQIDAAYTGTDLEGNVVVTTQGIQEWTVPTTGIYTIEVAGAKGGDKEDYVDLGGDGAIVSDSFTLTQGEVIKIVVGQMGSRDLSATNSGGGGGGGGTFVYRSAAEPLIVAGGGGGIGAGNSQRNPGQNATHTTAITNSIYDIDSGSPTYTDHQGIGYGGYSYGFLYSPDYDSGGGAGWLSAGKDGTMYPLTQGGQSLSGNFVGGNYDTSRSPYIALGGFGGGGAASDGGGGGGGYSGGNGGHWAGVASGGGGGTSFSANGTPVNAGLNSSHGFATITLVSASTSVPLFSSFGFALLAAMFGFFGFRRLAD